MAEKKAVWRARQRRAVEDFGRSNRVFGVLVVMGGGSCMFGSIQSVHVVNMKAVCCFFFCFFLSSVKADSVEKPASNSA